MQLCLWVLIVGFILILSTGLLPLWVCKICRGSVRAVRSIRRAAPAKDDIRPASYRTASSETRRVMISRFDKATFFCERWWRGSRRTVNGCFTPLVICSLMGVGILCLVVWAIWSAVKTAENERAEYQAAFEAEREHQKQIAIPLHALAVASEKAACKQADLQEPYWSREGKLFVFYCKDERGRLVRVALPSCNTNYFGQSDQNSYTRECE